MNIKSKSLSRDVFLKCSYCTQAPDLLDFIPVPFLGGRCYTFKKAVGILNLRRVFPFLVTESSIS
jgi:hypothetical protein